MLRCIYCQEERSKDMYSKAEHVLPQSFGKFRRNLTLRQVVCDQCNQYFGDHLETYLGRDTFEGQLRFNHGLKNAEEFKSIGPQSRITLRSTEGPFAGCYLFRDYSKQKGEIVVRPLPQVGFLLASNSYGYFLLDQIPTKDELNAKGYQEKHPRPIVGLEVDPDDLTELLAQKGISFRYQGPTELTDRPDSIVCQLEGTIDHVIFRAVAKIALNYLAYWEGADFVQHSVFDKARRYIRWGHAPGYSLVRMVENAILANEPIEGLRSLGHLITVNWAQDGVSILSQVSLFNWMTYQISLARDFTGPPPALTRGHLFNVSNHKILELEARPASAPASAENTATE